MAELPTPPEGIVLTHFIVSDDVERSRRFYTEVLGGRVVFGPEPINVALANSWIVINAGGGPTDDKPAVKNGTAFPFMRITQSPICVRPHVDPGRAQTSLAFIPALAAQRNVGSKVDIVRLVPGKPLPAGTGGSENYTIGQVRELTRRGIPAQVVTVGLGAGDGRDDFTGVPFLSLPTWPRSASSTAPSSSSTNRIPCRPGTRRS